MTTERLDQEIAQLRARNRRLYLALEELHAMVKGECSALLDDTRGGNGRLVIEIEAALGEGGADGEPIERTEKVHWEIMERADDGSLIEFDPPVTVPDYFECAGECKKQVAILRAASGIFQRCVPIKVTTIREVYDVK